MHSVPVQVKYRREIIVYPDVVGHGDGFPPRTRRALLLSVIRIVKSAVYLIQQLGSKMSTLPSETADQGVMRTI